MTCPQCKDLVDITELVVCWCEKEFCQACYRQHVQRCRKYAYYTVGFEKE